MVKRKSRLQTKLFGNESYSSKKILRVLKLVPVQVRPWAPILTLNSKLYSSSFYLRGIMKKFNKIIAEICEENKIKYQTISDNWAYVLEKDNKISYILGYSFNLNNQALAGILNDKYAFYELLKVYNFPIIKHHLFFRNYKEQDIKDLFSKYQGRVVVKSNYGTKGEEVFYADNLNYLLAKVKELLIVNFSISICPFYEIKAEYRVVVLDNKVKLIYGKKKPIVTGDGIKTIKDLLLDFNYQYFSKLNLESLTQVLPKGEEYAYNWQFNLSQGAILFFVKEKDKLEKLETMALDIASKINLRLGAIDIIETYDNEFLVMEANSGIMFDNFIELAPNGYEKAKAIYEEAILKMFD